MVACKYCLGDSTLVLFEPQSLLCTVQYSRLYRTWNQKTFSSIGVMCTLIICLSLFSTAFAAEFAERIRWLLGVSPTFSRLFLFNLFSTELFFLLQTELLKHCTVSIIAAASLLCC